MARFLFYDERLINILLQEEKPSGGAAVQAYCWIRGLSEEGHEIYILSNAYKDGLLKEETKNLNLIPLYDPQKGIRWLRWIYYRLPFVYNEIKKVNPDYVYQGIPSWGSFITGLICRKLNIKFIQRISNDYLLDDRFYKKYSKIHRYFQRLGIKLSDYILCQNDYQLNIIRNEYPDKTSLKISNPIYFKPGEVRTDISRKYIAWLGLYQYQKNLKLLYEIASLLSTEQFLVAGKEETNCDEETRKYLQKLEKLPNVKFTGFLHRQDVIPFLAKAKYILNTSHYEGFSNTFLEAMSVGTPIISSVNVNPDSIISKHSLGIVYKDATDLKNKFQAVSPEEYKEMSRNTTNYVMQNHNHQQLAKQLINLLENNLS
jgi:glycosyltransferase involved in cell wall biosynthesis